MRTLNPMFDVDTVRLWVHGLAAQYVEYVTASLCQLFLVSLLVPMARQGRALTPSQKGIAFDTPSIVRSQRQGSWARTLHERPQR